MNLTTLQITIIFRNISMNITGRKKTIIFLLMKFRKLSILKNVFAMFFQKKWPIYM